MNYEFKMDDFKVFKFRIDFYTYIFDKFLNMNILFEQKLLNLMNVYLNFAPRYVSICQRRYAHGLKSILIKKVCGVFVVLILHD